MLEKISKKIPQIPWQVVKPCWRRTQARYDHEVGPTTDPINDECGECLLIWRIEEDRLQNLPILFAWSNEQHDWRIKGETLHKPLIFFPWLSKQHHDILSRVFLNPTYDQLRLDSVGVALLPWQYPQNQRLKGWNPSQVGVKSHFLSFFSLPKIFVGKILTVCNCF